MGILVMPYTFVSGDSGMPSIEELQTQLAQKIEALDKERQENARKNQEERERMVLEIEMERQERVKKYEEQVAVHEESQRKAAEAAEVRRQVEISERLATEQKQNALDDTLRQQREKLEWLEKAISDAEFQEEQHRKSIENSRVYLPVEPLDNAEVSKEYPQTCADGGVSAPGTDGSTPESPLMSSHLKGILRQATRNH